MTFSNLTTRTSRAAAKHRLAASSVAPAAYGYERSLRPCESRFSPADRTICSVGER